MKRTDALYQSFVEILREELVPAMGCTEPIAIACAAALVIVSLATCKRAPTPFLDPYTSKNA